jgi:hypothetical protein
MSEGQRIGTAEREAAVADLKAHAAAGRISSKEYEERSLQIGQAGTWGELTTLFSDLPEPRPHPGGRPGAQTPSAPPYGDGPATGTFGTGSPDTGSYGGYRPPPAPYGGNTPSPRGRGGGPFGNDGPPAVIQRLLPLLPLILIGVAITTHHGSFLFLLFPVFGVFWGGGRGGRGGRGPGGGGRRRGRRPY